MKRLAAALFVSTALASPAALAQFSSGMTASALTNAVKAQVAQKKSAADIAKAALAAGVDAGSLTTAMLLAGIDPLAAIEAVLAAKGDPRAVQLAARAANVRQDVINLAASNAKVTLPDEPDRIADGIPSRSAGVSSPGGGAPASRR